MPSLLITPNANPQDLLSDVVRKPEYIPVPEKLMLFDKLVIMKVKPPPAVIRITRPGEQKGERLTIFENVADQNFLAQNKLIDAQAFSGQLTMLGAVEGIRQSFAKGFESEGIAPTDVVVADHFAAQMPEMNLCLSIDFKDLIFLPARGIPLEEVKEFKEKRRAEYDAFWDQLYELGSDPAILCRADASYVLRRKIQSSTENLAKVSEESWGRRVVKTFKLTFTFNPATAAALAAALVASQTTNIPPETLSLSGLAAIRASIDMRPSVPSVNSKSAAMSYLYSIRKL
ncbi:DUF6236 family protein [Roseovarius sp. 217]|uniref:DUF6236 family protein n=1 Tax=Roseovarius sp. (strain 217) TaxID=314264 RepID=UPI0005904959|nr:DUF6236 family protein [Roseovarius sp. 217]